jgi:hypothetical protein
VFLAFLGLLDSWALHVHLPAVPVLKSIFIHIKLFTLKLELIREGNRRLDPFAEQIIPVYSLEKFVFLDGFRTIKPKPFLRFDLEESAEEGFGTVRQIVRKGDGSGD